MRILIFLLLQLLYLACAQNDLDTLFEKTSEFFKELAPKGDATPFPTLPPLSFPMAGATVGAPGIAMETPLTMGIPSGPPGWGAPIRPMTNGMPPMPTFAPFPTFPTIPFSTPPTPYYRNATLPQVNITLDPEALMSVPGIIEHWGYPAEEYNVVTKDGYVLTLHRIPHGINDTKRANRPVVFLQHGLLCTSSIWLLNKPEQSAGFIFADAGFDVWLGNMRGNTYSKGHLTLDSKRPGDFWRFSWEEMARYDLEAMIDGVLNATKKESLYYVGHSQGTLTMFAKLSQDQKFAKKIRKFFALAPVSRMMDVKGLFHHMGEMYEQFNLFYNLVGDNEFLANNIFTRLLTDVLCDRKMKNPLCENFIYQVSGPDSDQFNKTRIGIYLAHNPAGTSWKNLIHFAQMVKTHRMQPYDYGREFNMKVYGTSRPPEYDLKGITTPTYLFYSDADWLATTKGVEQYLMKTMKNGTIKMSRKLRDFNHNDFLWGLRARKEIYDPIVNIISLDNRRLLVQDGLKKYLRYQSFSPSTDRPILCDGCSAGDARS